MFHGNSRALIALLMQVLSWSVSLMANPGSTSDEIHANDDARPLFAIRALAANVRQAPLAMQRARRSQVRG
jgi:hypothetical protein